VHGSNMEKILPCVQHDMDAQCNTMIFIIHNS
jgi:hypothetical protein